MRYLNSFNHYRAIAIVFIIAVHSVFIADLNLESYSNRFLVNVISGSTLNFSFISGFLFYLVLYRKYEYSSFLKARVDRFLKPYLFLSVLPILACLVLMPMYWDNSVFASSIGNNGIWYFISAIKYIVSGAHITAYWYIPFVMLMALISPLHVSFIKLKLKKQLLIFGVLLIIASVVQRPYERTFILQAFQSIIYFTPFYLMGIICAMQQDYIYKYLKGKEVYLLTIILAFIILQTNQGHVGLFKNDPFTFNGIDTVIFKMIFVCLFFMVWLYRFENFKSKTITTVANTSFAVYFLHVYVLKALIILKGYFNLNFESYSGFAFIVIISVLMIGSIRLAQFVNKSFPSHSYLLIGFGKKPLKPAIKKELPKVVLTNSQAKTV